MSNATTEPPEIMSSAVATPHPALSDMVYTTVFRPNVDGSLTTKWYESLECRPSDLLHTTRHHAFMYKEHMEYTTCEKAKAGLLDIMGPVHGVDWGCYYSETKEGWFRPECEITSHPLRTASETAKNLWKTPGGVVLILFIIAVSIFSMWWAFRCYRAKRCDWPWKVRRGSYAAARYSKKDSTPGHDSDDDVDVYSNGQPHALDANFAVDGGVKNPAYEE